MSQATAEKAETKTLANVRALLPEVAARAEEIEQARAVPLDLIEKLSAAGVYRRYVPTTHGGDELSPLEGIIALEALASADASTAWVVMVGSEGESFYAYLPPATYDKIYAHGPDVRHSGVINPTGKAVKDGDGYRFTGRWSFASGSNVADYMVVHGILQQDDGAPPATRFGVVPASQVEIVDTWRVSGLKGTASNDIVANDLYVPKEWTASFAELPSVQRYPQDQRPLLARYGLEHAAVSVGIAKAAIDDLVTIARNKVPATATTLLGADPILQYSVGTLATDLDLARALLHEVAREDEASVARGIPSTEESYIRRARLARVATVAASVVDGCYNASGTTGIFESNPLQRRLRDVHAVTQHYLLSTRTAFGPAGGVVLEDGWVRS